MKKIIFFILSLLLSNILFSQNINNLGQPKNRLEQPENRLEQLGNRLEQPENRLQYHRNRLEQPENKLEHPEFSKYMVCYIVSEPTLKSSNLFYNRATREISTIDDKENKSIDFKIKVIDMYITQAANRERTALYNAVMDTVIDNYLHHTSLNQNYQISILNPTNKKLLKFKKLFNEKELIILGSGEFEEPVFLKRLKGDKYNIFGLISLKNFVFSKDLIRIENRPPDGFPFIIW